ncbi:exo-beta-N-acetylmuramidase NamZ domain-containing protein [Vibrio owensii]|uniref:exo-beta-N-acetylmuramidase NamZ family protein n=1 Tax=Vibrio owensii TaxID=696485 RepID=UPI003AAE741B
MKQYIYAALTLIIMMGCQTNNNDDNHTTDTKITLGIENTDQYLTYLQNKRVGLVVNPTSHLPDGEHTIDFMLNQGVHVTTLFAPEHGIRGEQEAGEEVEDGIDVETGLPVISLYGDHKKPTAEDLENVDVLVFDIQDVGVRFYTYISTMHYVMESVAENNKEIVILDRPNPNGDYVAGPIMEPEFTSFVGMHPIPVVHGLTVGELANMINGERWLSNGIQIPKEDIVVAEMQGYNHSTHYSLPTPPSPNLQTDNAIQFYPSLGLFEATSISVGRGSKTPFEVIAYPDPQLKVNIEFLLDDSSATWPQRGQYVYGESYQVSQTSPFNFTLQPLYDWYWKMHDMGYASSEIIDRPEWLSSLLGTDKVLPMIIKGVPLEDIETSWDSNLSIYETMRTEYLIYTEQSNKSEGE